jgi:hypothetical protein
MKMKMAPPSTKHVYILLEDKKIGVKDAVNQSMKMKLTHKGLDAVNF